MSEFVLIDLDSQAEMVADHTYSWQAERILKWMDQRGQVRKIAHPFDDHLYSFRSFIGIQTPFRLLDDGQLIIVRRHSMHRPHAERTPIQPSPARHHPSLKKWQRIPLAVAAD